MSYEVRKLEGIGADFVFRLLERKHLLTLPVRNNPGLLVPAVMGADFYGFFDGDRMGGYIMETRSPQEHVLDVTLIPEDKTLCLHAGELCHIAEQLRSRWFEAEGWGKVQSSVPRSRKNTCRTLAALGFICETRSLGIRDGVVLGKGPEGLHIYGLLPSDPLPTPVETQEEAHAYS